MQKGFTKSCSAGCHSQAITEFSKVDSALFKCSNRHVLQTNIKNWLIENGFLVIKRERREKQNQYICSSCISFAEASISAGGPSSKRVKQESEEEEVDSKTEDEQTESDTDVIGKVINMIEKEEVSAINLRRLATALGNYARSEFSPPGPNPNKREFLINKTYETEWNSNSNKIFGCFLMGIFNPRNSEVGRRKTILRLFQKCYENICSVLNSKFISPLAQGEAFLIRSFSASKTATEVFSKTQPSGSYRTLLDTYKDIGCISPKFPKGDITIVFDNQQVIGRNYRVSVGGGQRSSIVTSMAVFQEEVFVGVQQFEVPSTLTIQSGLFEKYIAFANASTEIHRSFRESFISNRVCTVFETMKNGDTTLSTAYESDLRYEVVEAKSSKVKVYDMENLFVNPNSYKSVQDVLEKICSLNEESDNERKWILVCCDGVPYQIASKLVDGIYYCKSCRLMDKKTTVESHDCPTHPDIERRYLKIVLRPGMGHYEMNIVRAIFKVYFDIFIKPVAQMLGFRTPKALEYCRKALDLHLSWQILKIVFLSLTDELLRFYISKNTSMPNFEPSLEHLAIWRHQISHQNFEMAFDFVFNFLHPLFLFRAGIRQCNDAISTAALWKASSIFFGSNHPKYRYINSRDTLYLLSLPPTGSAFIRKNSVRLSSSKYGQGFDFQLEERNKIQKKWVLSDGIPTNEQWKIGSSSLNFFEELEEQVRTNIGLEKTTTLSSSRPVDLSKEYSEGRKLFRRFLDASPAGQLTTFSDDPKLVSPLFINCGVVCEDNKMKYYKAYLTDTKPVLNLVENVDMASLTIIELKSIVVKKIRQLPSSLHLMYNNKLKSCNDRADVLDLVGEVEEEIDTLETDFDFD